MVFHCTCDKVFGSRGSWNNHIRRVGCARPLITQPTKPSAPLTPPERQRNQPTDLPEPHPAPALPLSLSPHPPEQFDAPILAATPLPAPQQSTPYNRFATGRGKGGKGLGKGGAKRRRKDIRDSIQGISMPSIRRLARRGGVKRVSGSIYEEARGALKEFMEKVIRDAIIYTENANRKTITIMDVIYGLKRRGRTLYVSN